MRKPTLQSSKKNLWKVFSEYIRKRDKGICISCGKRGDIKEVDAGHYIPRSAGLSTYFDPQNVHAQCTACNRFRHGNLPAYAIALRQRYGNDILEVLDARRREIRKYSIVEYQELTRHYTELLKTL